jgi:Uncharacterized anaerobic dehydrogenase
VRRALSNARHVVVQSLELGSLEPFADAFLPAAAWVEREGHATDWEGRSQPIHPVRGPAGVSRPDWEIFAGWPRRWVGPSVRRASRRSGPRRRRCSNRGR